MNTAGTWDRDLSENHLFSLPVSRVSSYRRDKKIHLKYDKFIECDSYGGGSAGWWVTNDPRPNTCSEFQLQSQCLAGSPHPHKTNYALF